MTIVVFGVLILIHEIGHFFAAKSIGVQPEEFAVGMGPTIFSRQRGPTLYSLRAFPIGGFVRFDAEDNGGIIDSSLYRVSPLKRLYVFFAGAVMNMLLGLLISLILVLMSGPYLAEPVVAQFPEDAISCDTGLEVGDRILKINSKSVHIAQDVPFELLYSDGEPVDLLVERGGEKVLLEDVVFPTFTRDGMTVAQDDFIYLGVEKTVGNVLYYAFFQSVAVVRSVWVSLFKIVTGSAGINQLSGPVGTTTVVSEAVSLGFENVLYLVMLITINLGVVNLLPLPGLDGGKILFTAWEMVTRRRVNQKVENALTLIGFGLLLVLLVVVTFNDVVKLF